VTLERKADDLARYLSELGRQLEGAGTASITELFGLVERVRMAIAGLSLQEIAWAREHVEDLLDGLRALEERLQLLGRLKQALDAPVHRGVGDEWRRPTG